MKFVLYSFLAISLFYLMFTYLRSRAQNSKVASTETKEVNCFNAQNFEITYKYLHWKRHTAKKLSPNKRVILGSAEVEAVENEEGKKIRFWKNGDLYCQVFPDKGVTPIFKQQSASYRKKCQQLFCDLLEQAKFKALPEHYSYRYGDGSGNQWQINASSISYEPVTPANSSSGIYSGGEAFSRAISRAQFEALEQLLLAAWQNKDEQAQQREMGTGSLRQSVLNSPVKNCYLKSNSALKKQIEQALAIFKPE